MVSEGYGSPSFIFANDYFILRRETATYVKLLIIENLDAAKVELTDAEFASLEESLSRCKVYGHRGFSR